MEHPGIVVSEVDARLSRNPERGPVGWASCVLNGCVLLTNIAVLRGHDGALYTQFPAKRSNIGRTYYYFCPITREAKKLIDDAILPFFRR